MPKARMCACGRERVCEGSFVYVKERGVLTTNKDEASPDYPEPIGEVLGHVLKLNALGEKILGDGQ